MMVSYSKKIEMFFLQYIGYSDSDNERPNERYNDSEPEFGCAYARD